MDCLINSPYGPKLAVLGSILNMGMLVFMTMLIAKAAFSVGGSVLVPLGSNIVEVIAAIVLSVICLTLFPYLWGAIDLALARHYCRSHFLGTSWLARRAAIAFGTGCIITAPVIVLGAYLLAALSPSGASAFNVNAFGEALPELALFAGLGVPAAAYACANAIKVQSGQLTMFRQLYANPQTGTEREWRLAARSIFNESEWKLVTRTFQRASYSYIRSKKILKTVGESNNRNFRARLGGKIVYKANVSKFEN